MNLLEFQKKISRNNNNITHKAGMMISPTPVIHHSAKIGRDCYIGDHVVIGEDRLIGDNSKIESKVKNLKNAW